MNKENFPNVPKDKILFFDFDGTIANSEKYHLLASQEAVKQYGITIDISPYFGIGLSDKKIYKQIEHDYNITLPCNDIVTTKASIFEMMSSQIEFFPTLKQFITTIPNQKFIITNSQIPYVESCLTRWKIKQYFKDIISLYHLSISKADMIITLRYNPEDCILFDDADLTIQEANNKKIHGILVKNGTFIGG